MHKISVSRTLSLIAVCILALSGLADPAVHERRLLTVGDVQRSYALYVPETVAENPALVISLIVLSLNLFGDGLRDAFDPKLNG